MKYRNLQNSHSPKNATNITHPSLNFSGIAPESLVIIRNKQIFQIFHLKLYIVSLRKKMFAFKFKYIRITLMTAHNTNNCAAIYKRSTSCGIYYKLKHTIPFGRSNKQHEPESYKFDVSLDSVFDC
jgi:hypothetical protein